MPSKLQLSHKTLLLLGLLRDHQMTGYDLNRIVLAHGHLYADLKKGNIYHLLDGLARQGYVSVTAQAGARGPRGERLLYKLTAGGRKAFVQLLREVLTTFQPADVGMASAIVYLPALEKAEAVALLRQRREVVEKRLREVTDELSPIDDRLLRLAGQHLIGAIEAELRWVTAAEKAVGRGAWRRGRQSQPRHAAETGKA
jgi:DNA-binding PadR family transcriptional regulator